MSRRVLSLAGLLAAAAFPATALAQTVVIDLDPTAVESVGLDPDDVQGAVDGFISEDLELVQIDRYLEQMAEAAAFSSRGIGVDYASNPKRFVVGLAVGAAVSGLDRNLLRGREDVLPPDGYAAQAALMAGLNLGMFTPGDDKLLDRLVLYGNVMYAEPPGNQPIRGELDNLGVHLQAQLLKPMNAKVIEFGGIALTGGFERTSYRLNLRQDLPLADELGGVEIRWDGEGDYTLRSSAYSVPLEASTNLRVLVATVFGGVGVDLVGARSAVEAALTGDLVADGDTRLGEAGLTYEAEGSARPLSTRIFVGAQVNVTFLKLYGQLNLGDGERFGAHAGLRIVL